MADLPGGVESRPRRGYLDWMRGLAVLIMIEAHLVDSWTRAADRDTGPFGWSMILGGFGAPLFLFLAGVSVALSASSKARRLGDVALASRAVVRRGFEIFLLAFVFRVQAWVLGLGAPRGLLKVDILNIMGPSIMAAALLWGWGANRRQRYAIYTVAMLAMTLLTPLVRSTPLLDGLPDPLEAYLRPVAGLASFVFFPWAGFVFAGGILGVAIDRSTTRESEARLNLVFFVAGAAIATGAYFLSLRPTLYPRSDFWTSSPSYFFLRAGLLTMSVAAAYLWEIARAPKWSPMQQLGRTSLFIYWIHVELIYGLISLPLHKRLPLGGTWLALGAFTLLMLGCSLAKDRVVAKWRARRAKIG